MSIIKEKLTDKQLRIAQAVAGILSAIALIISIFLASTKAAEDNALLQYLFLIVFIIIMVVRRRIETKFRLRLNLFSLVLIDGILAGVLLFAVVAFYYSPANNQVALDEPYKALIVAGIALLLVVLGIVLPLIRYFKRRENGTLVPIRLPEEPEKPETSEEEPADEGPSTLERRIAEMTRDLDDRENSSEEDKPSE